YPRADPMPWDCHAIAVPTRLVRHGARDAARAVGMTAAETLDMSRCFLPEALASVPLIHALGEDDRRSLNQLRSLSYVHLFDLFETALADAARERAAHDGADGDMLAPLRRFDSFDHHELFRRFEAELIGALPVAPRLVPPSPDLDAALTHAAPI